jgi:DUF309 family protein family protein
MPGFPLPLRNALAALAIAALEDDDAADALRWLERGAGTPPAAAARLLVARHLIDAGDDALLTVHAPHAAAVASYATRALAARAAHRADARTPGSAVVRAAALWNAGLFFEVHEVLEEVWKTATGDHRQALQGVIQIAVAYHHLAHGNPRGARSLMHEGRERLASVSPDVLAPLDTTALLAATASWTSVRSGDPVPSDTPPPLRLDPIPRS